MGYHVTILRTKKGKPLPITKTEVESLLSFLPGSRLEPDERKKDVINVVISQNGEDLAFLAYQNGELWSKNPNENEILVMINIASFLEARVRGDDFKTFKTLKESYIHPDDQDEFRLIEEESQRTLGHAKRNRIISLLIKIIAFSVLILGYWVSKNR